MSVVDTDLAAILADPGRVNEVPAEAVPPLMAQCAAVQSALAARIDAPQQAVLNPVSESDQWLTVEEASALMKVSKKWLYNRAAKLPFAHRLSPRKLRFSEAGLRRWMQSRKRQ